MFPKKRKFPTIRASYFVFHANVVVENFCEKMPQSVDRDVTTAIIKIICKIVVVIAAAAAATFVS